MKVSIFVLMIWGLLFATSFKAGVDQAGSNGQGVQTLAQSK